MTVKDRIKIFISSLGLTNQRFEIECGLSNGYIANMRKGVGNDALERISNKYPELNTGWLLTGEGVMLKSGSATTDNSTPGKVIPFYDVEAAAGSGYGMNMQAVSQPVGMIEIGSILRDSESALRVYGNSMVPNYPAGCVVGLKEHLDSFIEPGCVFVVETEDNRYIKRLYYNSDRTAFRCISDNTMKHDDGPMRGEFIYQEFEIPLQEVKRIFRVTGVIKRNIL